MLAVAVPVSRLNARHIRVPLALSERAERPYAEVKDASEFTPEIKGCEALLEWLSYRLFELAEQQAIPRLVLTSISLWGISADGSEVRFDTPASWDPRSMIKPPTDPA